MLCRGMWRHRQGGNRMATKAKKEKKKKKTDTVQRGRAGKGEGRGARIEEYGFSAGVCHVLRETSRSIGMGKRLTWASYSSFFCSGDADCWRRNDVRASADGCRIWKSGTMSVRTTKSRQRDERRVAVLYMYGVESTNTDIYRGVGVLYDIQ